MVCRIMSLLQRRRANASVSAEIRPLLCPFTCRRTVTYAAVPTCIAVAAWDLSHQHEHHEEVPDYPYMRIRSKDFPWGPCGLFEMHCPEAEGGEE